MGGHVRLVLEPVLLAGGELGMQLSYDERLEDAVLSIEGEEKESQENIP